ncbi:hypothetical protein AVEN_158967-1 [Araneus ventricosus]|uniref:Reverse transcriptase domain-containing protein n=1 Tax=Araneus ventricosus TaxID=182803 RepID=A0A4Y2BA02_ARAVE|nr:hypothetical protein AVEN_158967-1 [Araneus ventricosus]
MDTALNLELPQGCYMQAFADDLIVVISGNDKDCLEENGNLVLKKLVAWGARHKLMFNASKTFLLPIIYDERPNMKDPRELKLNYQKVVAKNSIRYLGVI